MAAQRRDRMRLQAAQHEFILGLRGQCEIALAQSAVGIDSRSALSVAI